MSALLEYWFSHEDVWFHSTPDDDRYITQQFKHLLFSPVTKLDRTSCLEKIILFDQIVRHVYRGDSKSNEMKKIFGKGALAISEYVLKKGFKYEPKERCFILLPLRHTFQLEYVEKSLKLIQDYMNEEDSKYYNRFYKATLLSLSKIKTPLIQKEDMDPSITKEELFDYLDPKCFKNLTEFVDIDFKEPICHQFSGLHEKSASQIDENSLTISLSGGVDSMVCSFVLKHLSLKYNFSLVAVNVNYNNRAETKYEVEFVKRWCQLLDIPLYIRHITELKRDRSHNRDLYEKATKQMRFDMYRRFGNPVILGHNQDDCLENIFSNIKKARSYNNLNGMDRFVEDDGCLLVRPMLEISKSEIKAFAQKYKIPHLPNSTPSWCERGRIREQLVNFMEQFDPDLVPGFLKMANNMKEIYSIYQDSTLNTFFEKIQFNDGVISIYTSGNYGFVFWKDIFKQIYRKMKWPFTSNKSIENLVDRIARKKYGLIALSKTINVQYTENKLEILY